MTFEHPGVGALDYFPCRYGKSKLLFRGPRRKLDDAYVAVLGGTETYGKFVETPYPALLEKAIGLPVVNFGYVNAGTDVFVQEPSIIEACDKACVTVVQLMGAHNMSNRFYAVHPRRNDRFLRASTLMKTIFRDVDFTEFHFTRHMLSALKRRSPDKYDIVVEELKKAWVARMRSLLQKIEGESVLLWLKNDNPTRPPRDDLGGEPLLVDQKMVDAIRPFATELAVFAPSEAARADGIVGMHYAPMEEPAAAEMPGPRAHQELCEQLEPILRGLL